MRRLLLVLVLLPACGSSPGTRAADGGVTPDGAASVDGARGVDGSLVGDAAPPPDGGTSRTSLGVCWNDASCRRVLAVAHGGAWDALTIPYDSNGALAAAYADGDDGVKIDVRVTKDNVPVIAHSSPLQIYESIDCANKKIEEMTAAQVTACHRFPSSTETFQRLDDVLTYLRGKMVVQLCVKLNTDFARTIEAVHAAGAEDYAFLEVNASDLPAVAALPGSSTIYDLVNVASDLTPIDAILGTHNPRVFMIEIDPGVALGTLVTAKLHPAGVRAFIYDNAATPSVSLLVGHYDEGFDVVSSQSGTNGVAARMQVNTARGVTPP
jgi:glycerophosphoryl diester phosphodiesterase